MKVQKIVVGRGVGTAVCAAALLVAGCASTKQMRSAVGSGFLSDYTQLANRGSGTALLSYVKPGADLRPYSKILMEPVCAYVTSKESPMARLPSKDRQRLVNYFDAVLRDRLNNNFELVHRSGPGVLRMRVAITEAKKSAVLLDTVSTILPLGLAVSAISEMATGKPLAVGEIGVECEVLDAVTGERLLAAVDARVGGKLTFEFDKLDKWHTAKDALDFWAQRLHEKMCELKGKPVL